MKAMIFDADGTLLDSMGLWRRIDQAFLNAHHYPYSTAISEQVEVMSLQQSAAYFQQLLGRRDDPQHSTDYPGAGCTVCWRLRNSDSAMPFVPAFLAAGTPGRVPDVRSYRLEKGVHSKGAAPSGASALLLIYYGCGRGRRRQDESCDLPGLCSPFGKQTGRDLGV